MNLENNIEDLLIILNNNYTDFKDKQQRVVNECLIKFSESIKWDGPKLEGQMNNEERKLEIYFDDYDLTYRTKNQISSIGMDHYVNKFKIIRPGFNYNLNYEVGNHDQVRYVTYKLMYYVQSILDNEFEQINKIFEPVLDSYEDGYTNYLDKLKVANIFKTGFANHRLQLKIDKAFETGEIQSGGHGRDIKSNKNGWVYVNKLKITKNVTGTYVVNAYYNLELMTTFTQMSESTLEQLIRNFISF
jgi:hypothetical protein